MKLLIPQEGSFRSITIAVTSEATLSECERNVDGKTQANEKTDHTDTTTTTTQQGQAYNKTII